MLNKIKYHILTKKLEEQDKNIRESLEKSKIGLYKLYNTVNIVENLQNDKKSDEQIDIIRQIKQKIETSLNRHDQMLGFIDEHREEDIDIYIDIISSLQNQIEEMMYKLISLYREQVG